MADWEQVVTPLPRKRQKHLRKVRRKLTMSFILSVFNRPHLTRRWVSALCAGPLAEPLKICPRPPPSSSPPQPPAYLSPPHCHILNLLFRKPLPKLRTPLTDAVIPNLPKRLHESRQNPPPSHRPRPCTNFRKGCTGFRKEDCGQFQGFRILCWRVDEPGGNGCASRTSLSALNTEMCGVRRAVLRDCRITERMGLHRSSLSGRMD